LVADRNGIANALVVGLEAFQSFRGGADAVPDHRSDEASDDEKKVRHERVPGNLGQCMMKIRIVFEERFVRIKVQCRLHAGTEPFQFDPVISGHMLGSRPRISHFDEGPCLHQLNRPLWAVHIRRL
jgi:hypothetical protein